MANLAERLGYRADDRLVIVSCDDLGACHALNEGVYQALTSGCATAASIMVPAPWAREAASRYGGEDVGVHLTLNAEHHLYRWGPITQSPSLLDGEGGFPRRVDDLWEHADLDEVRRECRAQIERAIVWGFDVSHLASHLSAMTLRPEFFDVYLELAVEFSLPIRLPSAVSEREVGFPFRQLALDENVVFPDHFQPARSFGSRDRIERAVLELAAGVTELHLQPAIDTPEVRAMAPEAWASWNDDLDMVTNPEGLDAMLTKAGAIRIGFRELRTLMQSGA
jgi:chitin disaccharide deacetylase